MNNKSDKKKDKYNIQWDINSLNASSATELTGLIPSAPISDYEMDSYNQIMNFSAKDIVAKENGEEEKKQIK